MSISVAGTLEQGKDVVVEAALVKELGNNFEKLCQKCATVVPDLSLENPEAQRCSAKPLKRLCCFAIVYLARWHTRDFARCAWAGVEVTQWIHNNSFKTRLLRFSDHCDKALLDRSESGEFASELWQQITANGFHQLGDAASGNSCRYLCIPQSLWALRGTVPMSEIILGHRWG